MFTISDLKKHLGPGLGLRKNKYLLEIPIPGIDGAKINVLARSAGLPERNMSTTQLWHKGRKYNVRGETDYIGTYEVSILDDSSMSIRSKFDDWMKLIDNSKPKNYGMFSGTSYDKGIGQVLDIVKSGLNVANQIKNIAQNPSEILGFVLGDDTASYQTDINVWQLDQSGNKVYGYKLENAFPSSIGIVQLDDGEENTLSEFSITFSFSEFVPLQNQTSIVGELFGDDAQQVLDGVESLFE